MTGGAEDGANARASPSVAVAVVIQAAVAYAMGRRTTLSRALGALAASVVVVVVALYLVAVGLDLTLWVRGGGQSSVDRADLVGMVIFVVPGVVIGWLNGRAAFTTFRTLMAQRRVGSGSGSA